MSCRGARRRLSSYIDGDLPAPEARTLSAHLAECSKCGRHWLTLRRSLELLADLEHLESADGIAARVHDRLEVESRGPGLALLFRPVWSARPLMLPSLVPAVVVLLAVLAGALVLDHDPSLPSVSVRIQGERWAGRVPPSGTEGNPFFPSSEVIAPKAGARESFSDELLEEMGEGTIFVETVVARDGSVSAVTLLGGDSERAGPLLDALRRERFEPGRYRGRPVAVSVYWLISNMDVHAPIT